MRDKFLDDLKDKLPKFPGIHRKDKYFNSAVLMLLCLIDGEYHLLFERRAANISQGGEICFPGGKYDPDIDSDYEDTAIRETVEELGVAKEDIKIIGRLDTLVAAMGATIDTFVGVLEIDSLEELNINQEEVAEVFTMPLSYFKENHPQEYKVRLEIHPSYINQEGKEVITFPAKELGLPKRYTKPWGGKGYKIYLYQTEQGAIWGITAELIYDFVERFC
ncbi:8-oxo-dGTP pyrophosphatase MutT, NUDIX family [Orenia metallireducens]|jgi:8-oxo-dGTP pyrophosphatase MutT (NUDIX family)|uniref:8-oxo-dGTP pyrophosphatase MutT, NUDIX family n=1 Tax=Orenia metallireducens TaxID=1413210 RepID=A0A285GXF5_9FIRM|nr:CoA pyrophosphatase [Orenia metallireducens]SNY27963.1 8-oxo-dGTP pyrophosphatase MutT, NUDIX family [Orenia metallireducens]